MPGRVTVAIPTVDRAKMLQRALRSALAQDYAEVEVVVSDNASSTDMASVVSAVAGDRVVFQRHWDRLEMADNWNSCLEVASGEFFLLLSDDDVLAPHAVSTLMHALRSGVADPGHTRVAYGRAAVVDASGRRLWTSPRAPALESALDFYQGLLSHRRAVYPCATLMPTSEMREAGGYDGRRFGPSADLALLLACGISGGHVAAAPVVVCRYTEHSANLTTAIDLAEWRRVLREIHSLARNAATPGTSDVVSLDRQAQDFAVYFCMDVAGRRELATHGLWRAWIAALDAGRAGGGRPSTATSARLLAKLAFLRVKGYSRA